MDNLSVTSCDEIKDIDNNKKYKKLEFTSGQKMQISGLTQTLPSLATNSIISNAYVVKFPKGMNGHLMNYIDGGVGAPFVSNETSKIIAHASFHKVTDSVAVMNAFSIMSVACGQYYLSEINSRLTTLNQIVDKILEFLYSDKKAELISEVEFVKYAYENYSSIMSHDEHRIATIASIQGAKKTAIKDIEFYISDLNDTVDSKDDNVDVVVNKSSQIKNCLELSLQLYFISNVLEMYFARNFDDTYVNWIEKTVVEYIQKCEKRILSDFSKLNAHIREFKNTPLKKIDKEALLELTDTIVNSLGSGTESEMCSQFRKAIKSMISEKEYYINEDSEIYLKIA